MQWTFCVVLFIFARGGVASAVIAKHSNDFPGVLGLHSTDLTSSVGQYNKKLANEQEESMKPLKRYERQLLSSPSPWQRYTVGDEDELRTTGSAASGLASLFTNPEITSHSISSGFGGEGGGAGDLGHGHSILGGASSALLGASSLLGGSSLLKPSHHHDHDHGHDHKGGGGGEWSAQINEPAHAHTYFTKVPYISGYKLTPIYSEKKIIVKDFALGGGGIFQHGPKTGDDGGPAAATEIVRNEWDLTGGVSPVSQSPFQSFQPVYFIPPGVYGPALQQAFNGPSSIAQSPAVGRSVGYNKNSAYYLSAPGLSDTIDLNPFFIDASQLKAAQERGLYPRPWAPC